MRKRARVAESKVWFFYIYNYFGNVNCNFFFFVKKYVCSLILIDGIANDLLNLIV